jgi:hypothetical protein
MTLVKHKQTVFCGSAKKMRLLLVVVDCLPVHFFGLCALVEWQTRILISYLAHVCAKPFFSVCSPMSMSPENHLKIEIVATITFWQ